MATLPSSGALSMSDINAEFGRGNNLNSYRGTSWFTDAGGSGTFSSGAIAMSEFYGKRASAPITYVNPLGFNGNTYLDEDYEQSGAVSNITLRINTDGTWAVLPESGIGGASGNWTTPTTAGIGTGRYVRFTVNSTGGSSTGTSWTGTTGWQEIVIARDAIVSASSFNEITRARDVTYNVQIATDSGGTNVVTSGTVTLSALAQAGLN